MEGRRHGLKCLWFAGVKFKCGLTLQLNKGVSQFSFSVASTKAK